MKVRRLVIPDLFPWFMLLHAGAFCLYWLTNRLAYPSVNGFLGDMLGTRYDFVSTFVLISMVLLGWGAARLILPLLGHPNRGRWLFRIVTLVYLLLFYGSFLYLFSEDPVQAARLGQMCSYFGLFLIVPFLGLFSLLLRPLARKDRGSWARRLVPAAALTFFWLGGLIILPTNIQPEGTLPPKPRLIAHRGANWLAPENTLAAAQLAAQKGAYGLESDLRISLDGTIFLMHDSTLARTTNVGEAFPGRQKAPAESFTWAELQRLSAGQWFTSQDPAGTIAAGLVSEEDTADYRSEPIPSLAQVLPVVKQNNLVYIFDIEPVPASNPHAAEFFKLCLQQLVDAGLGPQVWFLANPDQVAQVKAALPGVKLAAGIDAAHPPAAADLVAQGYQVVNSEYSLSDEAIRAYRAAGLWVNLYTVDEPWQFSRLWLLEVDSITTNNLQGLAALDRPLYTTTFTEYVLLWIVFGLLSLALLYVHRLGPAI